MDEIPQTIQEEYEHGAIVSLAASLALEEPDAGMKLEELRRWLAAQVAHLLDRQPGLLMSHLYRIDVPEPAVQAVLQEAPPADIPWRLADLMIVRQRQKIETRRRYGQKP